MQPIGVTLGEGFQVLMIKLEPWYKIPSHNKIK